MAGRGHPHFAELVYRHTEGNALFMVNIVEHLVQQGLVTSREGQWTLRQGRPRPQVSQRGCGSCWYGASKPLRDAGRCWRPPASQATRLPLGSGGGSPGFRQGRAHCAGHMAAQGHFIDDIGLVVLAGRTRGEGTGFSMRCTSRCCTTAGDGAAGGTASVH